MRKLVWIINAAEVVKTVKAGKKLQGVIAWDDKLIVFNNYKRTKPRKYPIEILGRTDFGKVYRTRKRTKWSENMPTNLGAVHMARIMERDCKQAQEIIATAEIIDNV